MNTQEPIGPGLAVALIGFGMFIDFIQFLLALMIIGGLLDSAIDLVAMAGFGIMLSHHGGNILSRRGKSFVLTAIAEFVPFVNALPWWTLFAVYTVVMDRIKHRKDQDQPEQTRPRGGGSWRL